MVAVQMGGQGVYSGPYTVSQLALKLGVKNQHVVEDWIEELGIKSIDNQSAPLQECYGNDGKLHQIPVPKRCPDLYNDEALEQLWEYKKKIGQ